MTITAHVYQIHIAATVEEVWAAMTESDWTRRWFHSVAFVEPPAPGAGYRLVTSDGRDAIEGVIEELVPPADGRPGRLVQTWRVLYDVAMAAEPPSRVEWTVEQAGPGLTRIRLVHGDLANSPLTWGSVKDGWAWLLDALKTVLETGRGLPPIAEAEDETGAEDEPGEQAPAESDWHRRQGIEANNAAFELLPGPRDAAGDEELLRSAYAAAYHWQRVAGAGPAHATRADYLISRALSETDQPARALLVADRALAACAEHGLADFDLAYTLEARSRALRGLGRIQESTEAWRDALAVEIADPEDRAILDADFALARAALAQ